MSARTFWKAMSFLNRGEIILREAIRGNLTFEVGGIEVFRTAGRKWSCNHPNCQLYFNPENPLCSHVKACLLWLEGKDLEVQDDNIL